MSAERESGKFKFERPILCRNKVYVVKFIVCIVLEIMYNDQGQKSALTNSELLLGNSGSGK